MTDEQMEAARQVIAASLTLVIIWHERDACPPGCTLPRTAGVR